MKLKYEFAVRDMVGTYMAVAIGEGSRYYHNVIALNETGKDIFALLQAGNNEDEVVAKMLEEYDVTEERLRPEVQAIIARLREDGLIVED